VVAVLGVAREHVDVVLEALHPAVDVGFLVEAIGAVQATGLHLSLPDFLHSLGSFTNSFR